MLLDETILDKTTEVVVILRYKLSNYVSTQYYAREKVLKEVHSSTLQVST